MKDDTVYAILDKFHKSIHGDKTPEVRSDNKCFDGSNEIFFDWCRGHGADETDWYIVEAPQQS